MAAATSALRKGARPLHDRCTMPLTAKAERRKRRKASEVAAASVEPEVATEAPEPPAEPHNESEMEVEPAAPDQTANRLLLMTAEHEAAVARRLLQQGGRCWLHQLIDDDSEVFESEAKEEMVIVAREVDDYCLMVGDTRPEGIFGSTLAAEAVVAARDFEECVRVGTIVGRGRLGDWVVPDLSEEYDDLTEAEEAEARGLAARASYRRAIHRLKAAFPELPTPDPVVRRCVCSSGAPRWPWALDINCVDGSYCRGPDECRPFSKVKFLWRRAWGMGSISAELGSAYLYREARQRVHDRWCAAGPRLPRGQKKSVG